MTDVKSIQFGVMSDADIQAISACEITQPSLSADRGGVYDPRLGCTRNDELCATCGENVWKCSGHFGHIDLATPVIIFHKQVVSLLKCICIDCHRLVVSRDELKLLSVTGYDKTVEYLHALSACGWCKYPIPDIKYVSADLSIVATHKLKQTKATRILEPSFVQAVFNAVPQEDVELLRLDSSVVHPRNYVLTKFPVIPTCCRPKMFAGDSVCDDDLTLMLVDMLKANVYIKTHSYESDPAAYTKAVDVIRSRAVSYCDNSNGRVTHNTNHKPMTGIKERINCKSGLMRQNLTGKRCNSTARTVIGPDPTLRLDEVAVPTQVAETLTIPEYVTPLNVDRLTKLVNTEGKASTVLRKSGARINVRHARIKRGTKLFSSDVILRGAEEIAVLDCRMPLIEGDLIRRDGSVFPAILSREKRIELQIGDIVERYLQDGDPIYLNRQPTLHRNSMLGMRVVVKPGKTVRFNLAITKELNADFDGDEGNIFCCSSLPAAAELLHVVNAKERMLSAQTPKPEHCFVQDTLLAAYLMTKRSVPITRADFEQCLFRTNKYHLYSSTDKPDDRLCARDLFAYIFPDSFHYASDKLVVRNGRIVSGYFDKSSLGSTRTAIVRLLVVEYDKHVAADFIDNMHFVTNAWLEQNPFSIGLDDCMSTGSVLDDIRHTVQKYFMEANTVSRSVMDPYTKEAKINISLNKAKDLGLRIARDALAVDNKIVDTVTSGSKGDFFNIAQITGLLGQQNLDNSRPKPSLTNNTRSLVHYPPVIVDVDQQYESRGFIQACFLTGLNPKQMWFHAETGREGMIATALKTASSGYIQRSCVKLTEDLKVMYDGTVRDANGGIHQFAYGNTGLDPSLAASNQMPINVRRLADRLSTTTDSRRKLFADEVDSIVSSIRPRSQIPAPIHDSVWTKHERLLRAELEQIEIDASAISNFSKTIRYKYATALACPGECVGIICAQSIGEVQTQSNLNTFHTAGKLQTNGVDRCEEILKLTKTVKNPKMVVFFKKRYDSSSNLRADVGSSIVGLTLTDVSSLVTVMKSDETKHEIRFDLKKAALFSVLLSPDAIMDVLERTYHNLTCSCDMMSITISVNLIITNKSKTRTTTTFTDDDDTTTMGPKRSLGGTVDQIILELESTLVCGIPGITAMHVDRTDDDEYYVITEGSNLSRMLMHPLVDVKRLETNDVRETYNCLGIAATKLMIMRNLQSCISGVNDHHIRLLADKMTFKGRPTSITRYAMRVNDVGPLSKATFEQSVDVIQTAAFRGDVDNMTGVSAAVVAGNQIRVGTGMTDMIIDWKRLTLPCPAEKEYTTYY